MNAVCQPHARTPVDARRRAPRQEAKNGAKGSGIYLAVIEVTGRLWKFSEFINFDDY